MSFIAPFWLLGLLPWVAVVVLLLTGRRERTAVPFLELWRGGDAPLPKAKAAMHVPPLAVILLLAGSLCAILAAARPRVAVLASATPPKGMFVIDRGFSISTSPRWSEQWHQAREAFTRRYPGAIIEDVWVPKFEPWLIDARMDLQSAIREALRDLNSIVFVVTDQTLDIDDPRLIQVVPQPGGRNVGIASAAARSEPRPQVMVRIRNDSSLTRAEIKMGESTHPINLPPAGGEMNYFIDVNGLDKETRLQLVVRGDAPADNEVKLIRQGIWPRLEPSANLSPELLRMIETYRKLRPAQPDSPAVAITTGTEPRAAILVPPADRAGTASTPQIEDHPITAAVDWPTVFRQPFQLAPAPGSEWTILARVGDQPVLAVRDAPVRQVWVGFASESFARSVDFVVLWTNVFDWFGREGNEFIATGTFAKPIQTPPAIEWEARLKTLPPVYQPGRDVTPIMVILGCFMIFAASLVWGVAKTAR